MGLGGLPGGVGGVSLETDVDTAVVADLVTSRVGAHSVPLALAMSVSVFMAVAVLLMVRSVGRRSGVDRLLLGLGALVGRALLLKQLLLALEPLVLSLCRRLGLAMGLLLLFVVIGNLVGQESDTQGRKTAHDSNTDIGSALLVLERLDALHVGLRDMRLAASKACGGKALTGDAAGTQGQGHLALLLAVGGVDGEGSVQDTAGSVKDLAQIDGGKTDNSISGGLLVHDLEEELGLAVEGHVESLVPDRGLATVLVNKSLLDRLGVVDIEGELEVRVLLADGL